MTQPMLILILSLLLGVQPITTDLYLPALPSMTAAFAAPMSQAQLTLSALLLAFGTSQLVWGPLSDRFGRRPILLVGLSAYIVAAVVSAFAVSMEMLIVARAVQGAAMGASVMCARAIVRDLYTPEVGARMMSKGLSGLGVIACVSTPLGGLVADLLGWRFALMLLAVFGALTLVVVVRHFEETVRHPNEEALRPARLFSTWKHIVGHHTFWSFALLATSSYGGLFTYLAASSFVFIELHGLSRTLYGLSMFSMSLAYLFGTVFCRRMLIRYGVRRTVAIGAGFSLAGGTAFGLLALFGVHAVWATLLPIYLFMVGHGVHQPCGQSGTVGPFPRTAGAASAMGGFVMMVCAFAMGLWLGKNMDGTVDPLANGMWFWGVMTALVAWGLVARVVDEAGEVMTEQTGSAESPGSVGR